MPSIDRPLAGPMMTFDLAEQIQKLRGDDSYRRTGKAGRTLAKAGRFRLTMTAIAAGSSVATHHAESPMTVHVLEGLIRYRANGQEHGLHQGEVLFFGAGEAHDIRAEEDAVLLLTLSATDEDFHPKTLADAAMQG